MFSWPLVIDSLTIFAFLFFSFLALGRSGYKKLDNVLVASFSFIAAVWILANYVGNNNALPSEIVLVANYIVFAASFGSFFVFTGLIAGMVDNRRVNRLFKWTAAPLLAITMLSATPFVVGGVMAQQGIYAVQFGPLVGVYGAGLLYMAILVVYCLAYAYRHIDGVKGRQIRSIGRGLIITIPLVAIPSFIIPLITGNFVSTEFGLIPLIILVIALYQSAIRHGLFDIRLATVRVGAYALTFVALMFIYYVLALFVSTYFFGGNVTSAISVSPVNIALALVLAFVFQPIKTFFDKITNKLFYKDNYSVDKFILRLNQVLNSTNDLRPLLERLSSVVAGTLKAEQAFFFVYLRNDRYLNAGSDRHDRLTAFEASTIQKELTATKNAIVMASQLEEKSMLKRLLASHKIELILPLYKNKQYVGYLFLGDNKTSGYTQRDVRALNTIANELTIAIENALVVEEIRQLNDSLQQRINEATRELRASNAQLQRLDEAKDEFISMASHQLRTPLTSVKGYISMVVEGDAGSVNEQQKHLLGEAFLSSERMVRLIGEFLNVSRLQTGKFMIEKHPTDLVQVIKQEIEGLMPSAKAHGLALGFVPPKKFPVLNIDENKIRQVIMNFSDNAIYYSKEKTRINLGLKIEGPDMVFTVKDTGIGVPIAEQSSLFNKFFRATNARQQRPDGTGVGLFLAKKVIDAHHGEIIFESVEGKGSTFGFRLPLAAAKVDETTVTLPAELAQQQPLPR